LRDESTKRIKNEFFLGIRGR